MVWLQDISTSVCPVFIFIDCLGSHFGAVLDMICDRFCTCGLYLVLSHIFPKYKYIIILLMILEIVSHWIQMYR